MQISQVTSTVSQSGATAPSAEKMAPRTPSVIQDTSVRADAEKIQNAKPQEVAEQNSKVKEAVDVANNFMRTLSQNLEFSIDKDTSKTVVKVIDTTTNEVVKQFPSQEMLDIARALDRLQGVLHKARA